MEEETDETIYSFSPRVPDPSERRGDLRHRTVLRVAILSSLGKRELCLIRNISAGGMMVGVQAEFSEGQRVAIELKADSDTLGTVAWVREPNVGVEFDEQIDVEAMLSSQPLVQDGRQPRLPRIQVDRLGTLREGSLIHGISTIDISQGGVKFQIDQPLRPGNQVCLELEGMRPLDGLVRWCRDGVCGVSFNQVIGFRELMDWLRK